MKTFLQTEYDRINPNGNMAICYYVGNVNYPYLSEPVSYFSSQARNDDATNELNIRLSLFEAVGLLQSESVVGKDSKTYSLYSLTDEGEKYMWSMQREWGKTIIANENHFCFGRKVIEDVTSIKDKTTYNNGLKTVETQIKFKYRLENVPEWAKSPILEIYGSGRYAAHDRVYEGQVWLTKKNGQYYNYSSGITIEMERIGFYLL